LREPHDLRPKLVPNMPRLGIPEDDIADIVAFLVPEKGEAGPDKFGDADKGRTVLDTKGCGSCHGFRGAAALGGSAAPAMDLKTMARAVRLAPDLSHARKRFASVAKLAAWIRSPKSIKPDTLMPDAKLSEAEALDAATYIWKAQLTEESKKAFVKLPPLTRKVTFAEVDKAVFHRSCWHCHADPDYAIGDGGPGNSGGFGFAKRGLNLATYEGVAAGVLAKKPSGEISVERVSLFAKMPQEKDGSGHLVASLVARHSEENGRPLDHIRGMPLGMPPLTAEEIQLVESWVLQGRPK
jgi:cytochrome c2